MATVTQAPVYDAESDLAAWGVGAGIVLIQVCALSPGLLPLLLLTVPLLLPPLLIGIVVGVPVALLVGIWRLLTWLVRLVTRRGRGGVVPTPVPDLSN
jgi:hypothetical protein